MISRFPSTSQRLDILRMSWRVFNDRLLLSQEKIHRDAHNRSHLALPETIPMPRKYLPHYPTGRHDHFPICPVTALPKNKRNQCRALSLFLPTQSQWEALTWANNLLLRRRSGTGKLEMRSIGLLKKYTSTPPSKPDTVEVRRTDKGPNIPRCLPSKVDTVRVRSIALGTTYTSPAE